MRAVAVGGALGLVVIAGVGGVAAQSAGVDQEVTVLTLREALERASRFNPQYRQALNRMELEGPQRREALGAFLPSLRVNYTTGQSFRRERTALDNFGNPIQNERTGISTTSNSSQGVNVDLDLLRGGQRFHDFSRAQAQARVERLSAERELNQVLAEVQRQFLIAQRRRAQLAVEEALLAARESDYEVTQRLFELATVGRSEVLGAELDLETQRVAVREYRGLVDKAMLALRKAIGDPSLRELDVQQELPEPFDPASLDLDALLASALVESPTIGAAKASRSVGQSRLNSVRAGRWPTLSLSSGFSRSAYESERSALFAWNPEDFGGRVSLTVSIPLFRQFTTSQQIASADIELRNAQEDVRAAELDLEELVGTRYVDLETAWANVRQREAALAVAEERLRIVQEEYRLATKSIEELRTAVRDQATAQRDAVDQRFEFAGALLGLYEAAGIVAREAGLATTREQD
ncbi:MAG: TolC family protein [Gemmatimonadetes bacterium]|nr:TolC family protein [Gemmatimonadota bacterium]